jgi:hypothetical protein
VAAIRFSLQVELEGGGTYVVVADQRDVSRFEMTDFYTPRKHTMLRYLAWAASVRQGMTGLSWEQFTAECVEVGDVKPQDEPLDPGLPDPRTESSLTSSGGPAAG